MHRVPRYEGAITTHFSWWEAQCRCGCIMPQHVADEVVLTARWAETVREALGDRPINVISWYRCPSHNLAVKGAQNSQHLYGRAIDFTVKEVAPNLVQAVCKSLYPQHVCGLGRYKGSTHIDRRPGQCETWT